MHSPSIDGGCHMYFLQWEKKTLACVFKAIFLLQSKPNTESLRNQEMLTYKVLPCFKKCSWVNLKLHTLANFPQKSVGIMLEYGTHL